MGARGESPYKFSEHIVILCFKRRYPKQNSVICIKSSILPPNFSGPSQIFGLATPLPALPVLTADLPVARTSLALLPEVKIPHCEHTWFWCVALSWTCFVSMTDVSTFKLAGCTCGYGWQRSVRGVVISAVWGVIPLDFFCCISMHVKLFVEDFGQ